MPNATDHGFSIEGQLPKPAPASNDADQEEEGIATRVWRMREKIVAFDVMCNAREKTDTGDAWELLYELRDELGRIANIEHVGGMLPGSGRKIVVLNGREHATILAALRAYQDNLDDVTVDWKMIEHIANNCGTVDPLTVDEISDLCDWL